jgi:hypothetical protein
MKMKMNNGKGNLKLISSKKAVPLNVEKSTFDFLEIWNFSNTVLLFDNTHESCLSP